MCVSPSRGELFHTNTLGPGQTDDGRKPDVRFWCVDLCGEVFFSRLFERVILTNSSSSAFGDDVGCRSKTGVLLQNEGRGALGPTHVGSKHHPTGCLPVLFFQFPINYNNDHKQQLAAFLSCFPRPLSLPSLVHRRCAAQGERGETNQQCHFRWRFT